MRHGYARSETWWLLGAFVALALVLRLPDIGNPLIDLDEQFYLLVGERMWSGAIPYVDIWDRKPIGLFLIYWFARAAGGDPWIGYQVLALIAATATAMIVALLTRRIADGRAGMMAGAVYLVWLELLGGRGGQAQVFYNGLVAGAALLTWSTIVSPAMRWRCGVAAMGCVGFALQVKPTVVFEGGWFGLALLIGAWRAGDRPNTLARYAAALIAVALAPTVMAFATYAAIGHADAWWFANVESIFLRVTPPGEPIADRLSGIALVLLVPFGVAMFGIARLTRMSSGVGSSIRIMPENGGQWVIVGWVIVAVIGVLAVPPYFNHYALPLLVPVAVLAGIAMRASRALAGLVAVAAVALLYLAGYPPFGQTAAVRRELAAMTETIDHYRGDGCMFAFSAPPVLYEATRSCLPTRYPFATHLTLKSEASAIGVDPVGEVRRVLATRPPVIVTGPPIGIVNPVPYRLVAAALKRHYRRVGNGLGYAIYARRDRIRPSRADTR